MKTYEISIYNVNKMRGEQKRFATREQADKFFNTKLAKVSLFCEPTDMAFTYINQWGSKMMAIKLY